MGRKRKRRSTCTDDDETDEDIPLQMLRKSSCGHDANSYDGLRVPSDEPCELCEHVSKNRYSSLIHNVRHIIIPLINQMVYQCGICLHHFTSQRELNDHISSKHSLSELVGWTDLVNRNFNEPEEESFDSDLITIVKKEIKSPVCDRSIKTRPLQNSSESLSIKNRLLFEEDIVTSNCDRLLADLTTDCKVNVEWFPPVWDIELPESVHYDELIKPGVYRCKKCGRTFPSRYEAIIHEGSHFQLKNSQVTQCNICNQYVLGDSTKLIHHNKKLHPELLSEFSFKPETVAKKYFGGKTLQNGDEEPYVTKNTSLKICDMCYKFYQHKSTIKYICVGELSEIGKRHRCQKCGYKFFGVKLVKRVTKYKYSSFAKKKKKGVTITNEDRLKGIIQRFKMMKTYFCVLFLAVLVKI